MTRATKRKIQSSYYLVVKGSELDMENWTPEYYAKKYPKRVRRI